MEYTWEEAGASSALTVDVLGTFLRKSVAHEGIGAWSRKGWEGVSVPGELNDGAGRDERSAAKSNGDGAIEGGEDVLGPAAKKRADSSSKADGVACAVRNPCG